MTFTTWNKNKMKTLLIVVYVTRNTKEDNHQIELTVPLRLTITNDDTLGPLILEANLS